MSLTPDEIQALAAVNVAKTRVLADTALALYERNEALETVVRALAESDPIDMLVREGAECGWCHMWIHEHAPSCPWRQARELTDSPEGKAT